MKQFLYEVYLGEAKSEYISSPEDMKRITVEAVEFGPNDIPILFKVYVTLENGHILESNPESKETCDSIIYTINNDLAEA